MRIDGAKLAYLLAKQEYTQKELAALSGVSRQTISMIRCGKRCTVETAEKLAKALNVTIDELTF